MERRSPITRRVLRRERIDLHGSATSQARDSRLVAPTHGLLSLADTCVREGISYWWVHSETRDAASYQQRTSGIPVARGRAATRSPDIHHCHGQERTRKCCHFRILHSTSPPVG